MVPGVLARPELLSHGLHPHPDPLAVGVELCALISSLQGKQAVAVVVEDLQWADLPSAGALLFACRRLNSDRCWLSSPAAPRGRRGWARDGLASSAATGAHPP